MRISRLFVFSVKVLNDGDTNYGNCSPTANTCEHIAISSSETNIYSVMAPTEEHSNLNTLILTI